MRRPGIFLNLCITALTLLVSSNVYAEYTCTMPIGVPSIKQSSHLHMAIFWICVVISIAVFSVMFYSLIMHRKSRGVKPAIFHGDIRVEIFWAFIPFLILVAMELPATFVLMR